MIDTRFFKKATVLTIEQICQILDIKVPENSSKCKTVEGVAHLANATPNDIACYNNSKYLDSLKRTEAGVCLLTAEAAHYLPSTSIALIVPRPYRAYGQIASLLYSISSSNSKISSQSSVHAKAKIGNNCSIGAFTVIEKDVIIGDNCSIGPNCVIQEGVTLGNNCYLEASVTIGYALVGDNAYIKPGARIGQAGFGFHMDEKGHFDIPQLGRVLIGNDVQIGANTTIDRGSSSDTKIGNGVRIDNLVQIAHNVEIGDNSVIVAQVGIAGSTKLGKFVIAAGQVGIAGHLNIGNGVKIAAQSGLARNVNDNETVAGSPAVPVREWHKQTIILKRLVNDR
jgi:UDP-3-O-[3-hydroxymyristoyl] glucosamine N-acyltransferase